MKEVFVENKMRNKRKQRAMLQWWKPENAPLVRELLQDTGRTDLMGSHEGALVAAEEKSSSKRFASEAKPVKRFRKKPGRKRSR